MLTLLLRKIIYRFLYKLYHSQLQMLLVRLQKQITELSLGRRTLLTNQATPRSATTAHALLSKETSLVLKEEFLLVAILTKIQKHHVLIRLELPLLLLLKFPLLLLVKMTIILSLLLKLPLMLLLVPVTTIPTLLLLLEHSPRLSLLIATSLPRLVIFLISVSTQQLIYLFLKNGRKMSMQIHLCKTNQLVIVLMMKFLIVASKLLLTSLLLKANTQITKELI